MPAALVPTQRQGRRRRRWLRGRRNIQPAGAAGGLPLIWINPTPLGEPIDLECLSPAEADHRAARGEVPLGVMLSGAAFRRELDRDLPAPWLRLARRIVVCEAADGRWGQTDQLNDQLDDGRLRLLRRPFGARSFGLAVAWASGRAARWEADGSIESELGGTAA